MTHPECACCNAVRDELVAVHMLGRLKGRFEGSRMDHICEWLGLLPMDVSCTAIEAVFEVLNTKAHTE